MESALPMDFHSIGRPKNDDSIPLQNHSSQPETTLMFHCALLSFMCSMYLFSVLCVQCRCYNGFPSFLGLDIFTHPFQHVFSNTSLC